MSLLRLSRGGILRDCFRRYTTAAASEKGKTKAAEPPAAKASSSSSGKKISDIIEQAFSANAYKDAFKFLETSDNKFSIWTNKDMRTHTTAFANGLLELGYTKGDKIVTWLPFGSAEFVTIVLAASRIGAVVVPVNHSTSKSVVDLTQIVKALETSSPKAFIYWHDYQANFPEEFVYDAEEDGYDPLAEKLFPNIRADSAGLKGLTRLTGIPFGSPRFPTLKHVVHTGLRNYRRVLRFRNMLVYNMSPYVLDALKEAQTKVTPEDPLLVDTDGKLLASQKDLIQNASKLGVSMKLTSNQANGTGRLIVPTAAPAASVISGLLSSLMYESLGVLPGLVSDETAVQKAALVEAGVVMH
eukprot:CAMPEP_0184692704 /NCGR_PEP_ID=MMETSP0313-20130426/1069_1 /TAXON_ID=2792 /ORGANISM="Porphyridium aerugineum, Strain SAG 1380-2" /LENGTH=355 /DNA_ID=CAMNT_0027150553 /DNA_START=93 /DNA_END=1160 /DNA_ORIENTATION=+